MIETIFDYKFYIDKIAEFMMTTFDQQLEMQANIQKLQREVSIL